MTAPATAQPGRRALLAAGAAGIAAALLSACGSGTRHPAATTTAGATPRATTRSGHATGATGATGAAGGQDAATATAATPADAGTRQRAAAALRELLADYDGLAGPRPALRAQVLTALQAFAPAAAPAATTSASGAATAVPSAPSGGAASPVRVTVARTRADEAQFRSVCAAALPSVSPTLARLLAGAAAGSALRGAALGGTPVVAGPGGADGDGGPAASTDLSAAATAALQAALDAENAAVYGYGVLGAHLSGADRQRATADLSLHRALRDGLHAELAAAGVAPDAAAPGYELPFRVTGAVSARRLGARLEDGLAAVYANGVRAAASPARAAAAARLTAAALRGLAWGAAPAAFPGLPERAASVQG